MKYNSIFLIDKEPCKQDGKLRFRVKWGINIVAFNVGYRVEFDKWSTETQRCKMNTTHGKKKVMASVINREINKYEDAAKSVFAKFELSNVVPSADEFRVQFKTFIGRVPQHQKNTVVESLELFIIEEGRKKQWTEGTAKKYKTFFSRLTEYNSRATFADFNESGLIDYHQYLLNDKQYNNNTIRKELDLLRHFFNWAVRKGFSAELAYLEYSPTLKRPDNPVVFLDWDELMRVYEFNFNEQSLERVRDVFCFCCFTGLRYSDVANLRRCDIYDDYILVTTIKAIDSVKIELNDYSREILNKYSQLIDFALPVISNQKMNDYIKKIGEVCEIMRPIKIVNYKGSVREESVLPKYALLSTHTGRRTFVCNALMLGITPQTVMKWTGHSSYESMKPYIDVADKAKAEAMSLFNKKSPTGKIGD